MFWPFVRTKRRLGAERKEAETELARAKLRYARVEKVDPEVHRVATELAVHRDLIPRVRKN